MRKRNTISTNKSLLNTMITQIGYQFQQPNYEDMYGILEKVAVHNPILSASIRAIIKNANQPIIKCWNKTNNVEVEHQYLKLIKYPNTIMDYDTFLKFNLYQYLFDGNSYILKLRDKQNKVIALMPLKYEYIEPRLKDGIIFYYDSFNKKEYNKKDIIHWKDSDYGNSYLKGISPLKHLIFSLINNNYIDVYNKGILENGGQPTGYLKSDQLLKQDEALTYQKRWEQSTNLKNSGKVPVLGQGLEYITTGSSLKDMGYQVLKKVSREEILAIYKTPPVELGFTDGSNYANSQSQIKIFWSNTIKPLLESFINIINKSLFIEEINDYNNSLYYDFSNIIALQDDLNTKLDIAMKAYNMGFSLKSISEKLEIPFDVDDISINHIENEENKPVDEEKEPIKEEEKPVEEDKKALLKGKKDIIFKEFMKDLFLKSHRKVEKQFKNELEKYYISKRNDILDIIKSNKKELNKTFDVEIYNLIKEYLNKQENKDGLIIIANRNLEKASDDIVKDYLDKLSITYSKDNKDETIIRQHGNKIKRTWDTVAVQIEDILNEAIKNNVNLANLADQIRASFNIVRDRAITIARTETTSVANDLINNQLKKEGFEKKEWLSGGNDGITRESHINMDGEIVGINDKFSNGCDYPADNNCSDPAEVINCRCSILPQ